MMKSKLFACTVFVVTFLLPQLAQAGLWDTILLRGAPIVLGDIRLARQGVRGVNALFNPVVENRRLRLNYVPCRYYTTRLPVLQIPEDSEEDLQARRIRIAREEMRRGDIPQGGNVVGDMVLDSLGHLWTEDEGFDDELQAEIDVWVAHLLEGNGVPANVGQRTEMLIDMALRSIEDFRVQRAIVEEEEALAAPTEEELLRRLLDALEGNDIVGELERAQRAAFHAMPERLFMNAESVLSRLAPGSVAYYLFQLMCLRLELYDFKGDRMMPSWYRVADDVQREVTMAALAQRAGLRLAERGQVNIESLRLAYYECVNDSTNEMTGELDLVNLRVTLEERALDGFVEWILRYNPDGLADYLDLMLLNAFFEEHVFPRITAVLDRAPKVDSKKEQLVILLKE